MISLIRVARTTDRQILRLVDDLWKIGKPTLAQCRVAIEGINQDYPSEAFDKIKEDKKDIGVISSFDVEWGEPRLTVRFRRGIGGNVRGIDSNDRQPSPYFDEIGIENTGQAPHVQPDRIIEVKRLIQKHTQLPADAPVVGAASEAIDLLKLQFAQMNEQLIEVNTASLKRREELEDEYATKRRQLDEELSRHSEQLRERTEALDFDHKLRLEALEARQKTLDDRDHIHARRELRTHITDAIAQQINSDLVPRKASRMRWSVFCLLLAGAVGLGGVSAWSLYEFGQLTYLASLKQVSVSDDVIEQRHYAIAQMEAGGHWLVLARGVVSGAVAIGFLLYAISWLKGLYHDEITTRRALQRYATDLNRASWAIETIMEAKASGDVVIPDAVMAGVTHNLFEAPGVGKTNKESSANALAELLRTSGKARFGPNGAEFELSSRGANKLAEKIDQ